MLNLDVVDLRNFYGEPLGRTVREILRRRVRAMWPRVQGDRIMGLGYATPLLRPFTGEADRLIGLMPARMGVVNWPAAGPSATCLVQEDNLPLPDASIDKIILLHCLETAHQPTQVLRECWRVLAPGGRLIAIVPNRISVWARLETTPFGVGRPFSRGQLDQILKDTLFSPIDWRGALYTPPFSRRFLIRSAPTLERVGGWLWPAFSGVILAEATKQIYQGLPAHRAPRGLKVFQPVLMPQPTPSAPGEHAALTGQS